MSDHSNLVLIVDDEPDMCWARKALTALEALKLMERHRFACAFLDAKLPDMDGLELARRLRERAPDLRILMVSGYFYRDDVSIQEAISQGLIRGFISKPFLQEEILQAQKA
jgi:CheY-like chemotaxis protein